MRKAPWLLLVLVLLGFAVTDFLITITLSTADATAHLVENPYVGTALQGWEVPITVGLVLVGTVLLVYLDRDGYVDGNDPDNKLSLIDSIYYTTVTLSTTGYGDIAPFTDRARLINAATRSARNAASRSPRGWCSPRGICSSARTPRPRGSSSSPRSRATLSRPGRPA